MQFKEYVLMGLRDLWRRKGRTILTSLGITIGTLLIVTMIGLGTAAKDFMTEVVNDEDGARSISLQPYKYFSQEEADSIDVKSLQEDYSKPLTEEAVKKLAENDKVDNVIAEIYYRPDAIKFQDKEYSGNLFCVGYNSEADLYTDNDIQKVRHDEKDNSLNPLKAGDKLKPENGEAVIGIELLDKLKLSSDDVLGKEFQIEVKQANGMKITPVSKSVKITGVIEKGFKNSGEIVLTAKDAAELSGYSQLQTDYMNNNGYDSVKVVAKSTGDVESLSNDIKEMDYAYESSVDTAKSIEKTLNSVNAGFAVLGVIVIIVSAIGIVNTMSMAVVERTKSIGIMKAVGADRGAVKTMFLIQSSLIGLVGGIVGLLLGSGINTIAQYIINSQVIGDKMSETISIGLPFYWLITILAFAVAIALISGIYPAAKASKLDPIEALTR